MSSFITLGSSPLYYACMDKGKCLLNFRFKYKIQCAAVYSASLYSKSSALCRIRIAVMLLINPHILSEFRTKFVAYVVNRAASLGNGSAWHKPYTTHADSFAIGEQAK